MNIIELNSDKELSKMIHAIQHTETQFIKRRMLLICLMVKNILDKKSYDEFIKKSTSCDTEDELKLEVEKEHEYFFSQKYIDDLNEIYHDGFNECESKDEAFILSEIKRIKEQNLIINFEL
jgi:hypothetical protein